MTILRIGKDKQTGKSVFIETDVISVNLYRLALEMGLTKARLLKSLPINLRTELDNGIKAANKDKFVKRQLKA